MADMRDLLVPVGFRLPLEVIKRIDDEVARQQTAAGRYGRVTRSEVIVEALRKALPPAGESKDDKKKKKPARRAA